jgi:hypothetical protein
MSRPKGRTADCSSEDARNRLERAEAFLAVAELVLGERIETNADHDEINLSGVAAALAVLAGIAAADAACCHRLGTRSRGQDHAQAVALVKQVIPHGDGLANDLDRLLDLKDNAHYGVLGVADEETRRAVEWARRMLKNTSMVLGSV